MSSTTLISSSRVFPDEGCPTLTVPLSILDSGIGQSPGPAFAWVYDVQAEQKKPALNAAQLKASLIATLNAYPQWAGQLEYTPYIRGGNHSSRSRRLQLTYGAPIDPGVEFILASSSANISDIFPSPEERSLGASDVSFLDGLNLLPNSPTLASCGSGDNFVGLPCVTVQVTSFQCGGTVIAVTMAHPLADARTLTNFGKDWAAVNRALVQNLVSPILTPIFSPAAVDQAALGDIDAVSPDPEILKIAHGLPIHRWDMWASADRCPANALELTKIPPHLASVIGTDIELGEPMPWHELNLMPVESFVLHFSADELVRIRAAAASPEQAMPICTLDALQAHLWSVIIRAREPEGAGEQFNLIFALGIRERLAPPLDPRHVGSPVTGPRAQANSTASLPQLARTIRETVAQFTPPAVGALLHQMAFDVDARRMCSLFTGRRNTAVTTWVRLGVWEVDFGAGRPRYISAVLPPVDGVVVVTEAMPQSPAEGPWYRDGVRALVKLTTDVMQKLLRDPLLRKYQ
ncbi:transferase family-domain-containing protein [Mycena galopus ATCC 62051]|nr:transferase family-domain-containing protein [Mycena galopus ATCC 62051]